MPQLGAGLFERGVRGDGDVVLRGREGSRAQGARRRRAGRGSPPAARVRLRCWLNSDSQAGMRASSIGTLTRIIHDGTVGGDKLFSVGTLALSCPKRRAGFQLLSLVAKEEGSFGVCRASAFLPRFIRSSTARQKTVG